MNQRLQSCPTCVTVQCCSDNPFNYSLVNGPVYGNDQQSIDFTCPPGFQCIPGVYTVPANTIRYTPQPESSVLRIQCCQSEIVRQVPVGATDSQIGAIATDMVNACALQLAYCQANQFVRRSFQNEEVCQSPCAAEGKLIGWFTPSPPPLVPAVRATVNQICVKGGVFSSQVSQADANAKATQFLTAYVATLFGTGAIACGYWNTEQVCPDSDPEVVIPAFSFFSAVSQAEADALALASCPAAGNCFDWTTLSWEAAAVNILTSGGGTGDASMVGSGDEISGAVDLLENVPFTGDVQMEMIMNGSAASYTSEECQGVIIIEVVPVSPGAQLLNGILTFTVDGNAVSSPFGFSWMIDYQTEAPYSNTALHPFTAPAGTEVPVSLFVAMTGFANSSRPINQASYRAKIMQGAWTGLTGNAIMPVALFSTVTLDVESSDWMGIGDTLWFQAGTLGPGIPTGYVEVMSIPSSTQVEIRVLSYVGDNGAGIEVTPGFYLMQRTPNDL